MEFSSYLDEGSVPGGWVISPLVGDMGGSPEGGAVPPAYPPFAVAPSRGERSKLPPSALPGISPTRGEIGGSGAFTIAPESPADLAAREALLDRAMGPSRKRKSSEKLRRGRAPSKGLAFIARDAVERVVGTVRLWDVAVASRDVPALLLGPLAVDPDMKGAGIGSALMLYAIAEARRLGHRAILLVGDAPYYERFGFSAEKTASLSMPGPYERHRFLALELTDGALDGAEGVLKATGRKLPKSSAAAMKKSA